MFNEFYPQTAMKPSTSEYFRIESPGLRSLTPQSGIGQTLFSTTPLFSLCDQLSGLNTGDISDFGFGLNPGPAKEICSVSPTNIPNSLLGSSLHLSVSRSYSDSSRQDRSDKNIFHDSDPFIQVGWTGERESGSPFVNPDPWSGLHQPVSKCHSEVFRTYSGGGVVVDELPNANSNDDNDTTLFLPNLRKISGSKSDFETNLKNYQNKVFFALKLGYSEALLQKALVKLGHNAEENQILEELIKLQKSKPSEGSNTPLSKQHSDDRGSCNSVKIDESGESEFLPIVIDGSNVAMSHGNKERFSCKGIRICVDWFLSRGHRDVTVFVPLWRKEASNPDKPISDQLILLELEKEGYLKFTPSRQVSGRRFVCHDDRYVLNLASETNAIVVSNDNYRELVNEKPEFKKVIEERILMYTFVNDRFMPPDDPMGRNGPTLDVFLRKPKHGQSSNIQPCPYEKKCTYGNKCKFYHADRGNLPQKSISDKLKENSSKRINEARVRSPSNESATGDQLMRTKSMQPMTSTNSVQFATKKALARTKSLNPNLERQQQQQQQHHQTLWAQMSNQFLEPDRAAQPVWSQPNNMVMLNPTNSGVIGDAGGGGGSMTRFSVDVSRPPPMPHPWVHPVENSGNSHRKLARQLTLNPTYDPRIHAAPGRFMGESGTDPFSYPPPSIVSNFSHQHFAVKRNASAPEPSSQRPLSRSPVPHVVQGRAI